MAIRKYGKKQIKHPYIFLVTYMNHVQKSGDFLRHLETFFEFWGKKKSKYHWICNKKSHNFQNGAKFCTKKQLVTTCLSLWAFEIFAYFNLILKFANVQSLEANLRICIFHSELQRVLGSCNYPSTTRLQVIANTKSTVDLFHNFYHGMNAIGT